MKRSDWFLPKSLSGRYGAFVQVRRTLSFLTITAVLALGCWSAAVEMVEVAVVVFRWQSPWASWLASEWAVLV